MAGTLTVQNLQGPSSGANANKVIIPSGQTLQAAGHVIQTLSGSVSTQTDITSSGSWVDLTGGSLSITPSSSSNKVLCTVSQPFRLAADSGIMRGSVRMLRGSTVVWNTGSYAENLQVRDANNEYNDVVTFSFLDSPSSTSSTTYKIQGILTTGSFIRLYPASFGSSIILQEIAQ